LCRRSLGWSGEVVATTEALRLDAARDVLGVALHLVQLLLGAAEAAEHGAGMLGEALDVLGQGGCVAPEVVAALPRGRLALALAGERDQEPGFAVAALSVPLDHLAHVLGLEEGGAVAEGEGAA